MGFKGRGHSGAPIAPGSSRWCRAGRPLVPVRLERAAYVAAQIQGEREQSDLFFDASRVSAADRAPSQNRAVATPSVLRQTGCKPVVQRKASWAQRHDAQRQGGPVEVGVCPAIGEDQLDHGRHQQQPEGGRSRCQAHDQKRRKKNLRGRHRMGQHVRKGKAVGVAEQIHATASFNISYYVPKWDVEQIERRGGAYRQHNDYVVEVEKEAELSVSGAPRVVVAGDYQASDELEDAVEELGIDWVDSPILAEDIGAT